VRCGTRAHETLYTNGQKGVVWAESRSVSGRGPGGGGPSLLAGLTSNTEKNPWPPRCWQRWRGLLEQGSSRVKALPPRKRGLRWVRPSCLHSWPEPRSGRPRAGGVLALKGHSASAWAIR